MMKKVLLLALVAFAGNLVAQTTVDQPKNYNKFPSTDQTTFPNLNSSKQGGNVDGWFFPEDFIRNNSTGPFQNFVNLIFPDSTVVTVDENNEVNNVFAHAFGHLFDLRHENWAAVPSDPAAPIMPFSQKDSYSWDTVEFLYLYRRNNPDVNVVDTAFVSYYKNSIADEISRGSVLFGNGDTMLYATVKGLNVNAMAGENAFKVDTILLNPADTTTFSSTGWGTKSMVLPVGTMISGTTGNTISRNPLSWFAYTVTYKPGHAYSAGDTIESRGFTRPGKGLNYFGYRFVTISSGGLPSTLRSRDYADNSLVLYNATRYGQTTDNGWSGFMPGVAFNSPIYNNALARVSGLSTTSAEEIASRGYSLGKSFPNPVANGQTMTIDYGVKTTATVSIEIYDLLGKKVASVMSNEQVEAGDHTANFNVSLQPGIYFYTMTAGDVLVGSKKFSVIR